MEPCDTFLLISPQSLLQVPTFNPLFPLKQKDSN